MNHDLILGTLVVAGYLASSTAAGAADAPTKKPAPGEVSSDQTAPAASKIEKIETRPKSAKPLKWDRLDPKSLEKSAKDRRKSPFNAVPSER